MLPDALTPKPVVILEGILVLAEEALRRLHGHQAVHRRRRRRAHPPAAATGTSRSGDAAFESVQRQYLGSVRPMHLEFVEPSKRYADLIIPEGARNEVALEAVVARIRAMLVR